MPQRSVSEVQVGTLFGSENPENATFSIKAHTRETDVSNCDADQDVGAAIDCEEFAFYVQIELMSEEPTTDELEVSPDPCPCNCDNLKKRLDVLECQRPTHSSILSAQLLLMRVA